MMTNINNPQKGAQTDDEYAVAHIPPPDEGNARLFYLKDILGLSHDPFAFGVSEQELQGPYDDPYFFSYYVDPPALAPDGSPAIAWLRQARHALIFGAPGTGKTALRLTLEAECRTTFGGPKTLVVTHLLGDDVSTPISANEHWHHLANSLAIDLLIQVIEQFNPLIDMPTEAQITALRQQLMLGDRRLQRFVSAWATNLETNFVRDWPSLGRPVVRYVPSHPALHKLLNRLQIDHIRPPTTTGRELLQKSLNVARLWGFEQVFVLIDEVDAREREPEIMLALIQPFLDSLDDWAELGLYFKFFLSDELQQSLPQTDTTKLSNLSSQPLHATIKWEDNDLSDLLLQRFIAARADLPSVDMLAGTGLAGKLTSSLLQAAKGSPRILLELFSSLIDVHCRSPERKRNLLLDAADWEAMREELWKTRGWEVPALLMDDRAQNGFNPVAVLGGTIMNEPYSDELYVDRPEQNSLWDWLRQPPQRDDKRLASLIGPTGIGKSWVLEKLSKQALDSDEYLMFWANASTDLANPTAFQKWVETVMFRQAQQAGLIKGKFRPNVQLLFLVEQIAQQACDTNESSILWPVLLVDQADMLPPNFFKTILERSLLHPFLGEWCTRAVITLRNENKLTHPFLKRKERRFPISPWAPQDGQEQLDRRQSQLDWAAQVPGYNLVNPGINTWLDRRFRESGSLTADDLFECLRHRTKDTVGNLLGQQAFDDLIYLHKQEQWTIEEFARANNCPEAEAMRRLGKLTKPAILVKKSHKYSLPPDLHGLILAYLSRRDGP